MEKLYLSELFLKNFSSGSNYFKISYQDDDGTVLHGVVKQINAEHFEVLIEEKEVIIHCTKNEDGVLTCDLNRHRNPPWVDGISREVAKKFKI